MIEHRGNLEAEPVWFGPSERPLLGWLDRPARGQARGGIVICPPVGIELGHSHYTLRCLARELRSAGFAVLRFDYDGTGQSAGEMNDPGRVDAWRRSVGEALGVLRDLGVPWLGAVGLRLGATLLADVAAGHDTLDAVVLWDPCQSGKAFLREQVALHVAACPPTPVSSDLAGLSGDGSAASDAEILGHRIGEPLAAELRGLALPEPAALAGRRVMVLADPARIGNRRLAACLPETVAEWHEYVAPEPVFDPGERRFDPPRNLLAQIVDWLDGACDAAPASLRPPSDEHPEAVVGHAPDGSAIVETVMRLGEHRLAAIACAPASGAEGPTVLFVSLAAESSIGPVRQWVELARRWAATGVRSVRLDLSGVGESPARTDLPERTIYANEHVEEIAAAAAAVCPEDPRDVVLMGVCSGAIQTLAAAPRLRPRGIIAINPILTFTMPDRPGAVPSSAPPAIPRVLGAAPPPTGRRQRWRRSLRARMPRVAWTVIYALGRAPSPDVWLRPVAQAGVSTLLMLGANEAEVPLHRTPSALARLRATGSSRVALIPELDHSLRDQVSRELAAEAATAFLAEVSDRSPTPTPAPSPSRAKARLAPV